MPLLTSSPDFAQRALAALNVHRPVETPKGVAYYEPARTQYSDRPYTVHPIGRSPTYYQSAPLAVAALRAL